MLLGRLRIRGKLALLVIIPMLSVVALTVPVTLERVDRAERASDTADAVRRAGRIGALIQDIQLERMLSVGYLMRTVDASRVQQQAKTVTDHAARLTTEAAGNDPDADLPPPMESAVIQLEKLAPIRAGVLSGITAPDKLIVGYGEVVTKLIDSLRLEAGVDVATSVGRQVVALDASLRTDELITSTTAYLLIAAATKRSEALLPYYANFAVLTAVSQRFQAFATQQQVDLYLDVQRKVQQQLGTDVTPTSGNPLEALFQVPLSTIYPALEQAVGPGRVVSERIIADVTDQVNDQERRALTEAYVVAGVALLIVLLVALLSVAVARAVVRPLTRLTRSADRVARVTEEELTRVADDEAESPRDVRIDPIEVAGKDEIGDLARAFSRVQGTAVSLVERQVASRRNVAQMFGHVGRRTQNLVGRQIAVIDQLEEEETSPDRLQHLYRLDHISSRLRRNAGSLVVLSGATGADEHLNPLPLADVVRLALGEIEDYTRVDVLVPAELALAPAVISDVVLVLAELMENATVFSPPHTRVTVSARATPYGAQLAVVDHGIGMTEEQLAQENARLQRRERLDLAPTGVLGLFVVGRLARRHGLRVLLGGTPGGGVTATVDLPEALLAPAWAAPQPAPVAPQPAGVGPGAGRPALVSVEYRIVEESAVPAMGPATFNLAAVNRASRSIATGTSWSAFVPRQRAKPDDAPVAGAAPDLPHRMAPSPQPVEAAAPLQGADDQPTAVLPIVTAGTAGASVTAESARALVEEFEAGVRRAQSETAAMPVRSGPPAPAVPSQRVPQPAAARPADPPTPVAPVSPSAAGPLTRRQPGATLQSQPDLARTGSVAAAEPPDPDEARHLVEQFEAGVVRALGEVRSNQQHEEGSTR